jgi:uncharacterized circularly permuted ATP-grasp superfamily protein
MSATVAKTRNHFSNIFSRLSELTHNELERSAPKNKEMKKDDFIRYYSNINTDWRI